MLSAMKGEVQSARRIRAIVVDDSPEFLEALCGFLETRQDMDVVGRGRNGLEALQLAELLRPELAFLDMDMPELDGLQTAARLHGEFPELKIAIVSVHEGRNWSEWQAMTGVDAFISKPRLIHELPDRMERLFPDRHPQTQRPIMGSNQINVLLVEKDDTAAGLARQALLRFPQADGAEPRWHIEHVPTMDAARNHFQTCHVCLVGLQPRDGVGLQQIRRLRQMAPHLPVIAIAHSADERLALAAAALGVTEYFGPGQLGLLPYVVHYLAGQQAQTTPPIPGKNPESTPAGEPDESAGNFRQKQKLDSIGLLAAGIAHDFINVLTVVQTHAGLLLERRPLPPGAEESIREISKATNCAAGLTRQLLTFCRKQDILLKPTDLNGVVNDFAQMLRRILGTDITLVARLSDRPARIRADEVMLEQLLINLAANARDAMPGGGQFTVETAPVKTDADLSKRNPGADKGGYLRLTVTDTGGGIPPEALPHIFEPFFTTKKSGKGTGLGLATAGSIVKQHGGWIEVDSQPGKGASFNIFFPRCPED
jgi:signal transduction histidine kinase